MAERVAAAARAAAATRGRAARAAARASAATRGRAAPAAARASGASAATRGRAAPAARAGRHRRNVRRPRVALLSGRRRRVLLVGPLLRRNRRPANLRGQQRRNGRRKPAGVSYVGCTFIGGLNRVVVSKRDPAGNQCLSFALTDGAPAGPTHAGADATRGLVLEVPPARLQLPGAPGNALDGQVTGTISWAGNAARFVSFPMRANIDVTLMFPANDAGASSMERIEAQNIDVLPNCDSAADQCSFALPVRCGDRLNHSTVIEGRANAWDAYGRTARGLSGRETIYSFSSASTCTVVANLKGLTTDLDLLLLSACDPLGRTRWLPPRHSICRRLRPSAGRTCQTVQLLVVDGYAGAEGSYSLEVDCTCP